MAVEARYVVVRKGEEVLSTTDKKQADEYDKMLDIADAMSDLISRSGVTMNEQDNEELSVYLAQHKNELLTALGVKKAKPKVKVSIQTENSSKSLEKSSV